MEEDPKPANEEGSKPAIEENPKLAIEEKIKWVEEKVTPTTRWIENVAKPFTTWIEGKIHGKEKAASESQKYAPAYPPAGTGQPRHEGERISAEAAVDVVQRQVQGEVLKVKYIQGDVPLYRVKLISRVGEIHILHVHAITGEPVTGQGFPRPTTN